MNAVKIKQSLLNLGNALERLKEATQEPESNRFIVDATIQRFEFVLELMWKTIKRCLESEGIKPTSPKDTLKKAFAIDWLQDEVTWLDMLNDRNITSHVYHEEEAKEIYYKIKNVYYAEVLSIYKTLRDKFEGEV